MMKFFVCDHCGNLVDMVKATGATMMCCGQMMTELIPGISDGAADRHTPIVCVEGNKVTVTVGSKTHPMDEEHYIEWILIETKYGVQRKYLTPDDEPYAEFLLAEGDTLAAVYAYCNLHGQWKA